MLGDKHSEISQVRSKVNGLSLLCQGLFSSRLQNKRTLTSMWGMRGKRPLQSDTR